MYDFQVQDAKEFMKEKGIVCKRRFLEPIYFFNRRYEKALESAYNLKKAMESVKSYLSCMDDLISENVRLNTLLGNPSKKEFLFPKKPNNLKSTNWISYEESIKQMYRNINSDNTDLRAVAISRIFDEAITNIPQGKTVICLKSAYVPKPENAENFDKAIVEMAFDGKDTGNFGIACCGMWYEWFAFKAAKIDNEKLKEFKKLYLANPFTIQVTYA